MTINNYSGVLYDTIYYNVIFFNQDRVRTQLKTYAEKESDIFTFYDEIRSSKYHIDPPECLYPFFYYDIRTPCVMSEYFHKHFDFFKGTGTGFFKLLNEVESFKRYVFYFYLEQYRDKINIEAVIKGDNKEISKALISLRHHGERADTFIDLFYDFQQLTAELLRYIKHLHNKMNLFHIKKKELYQEAIDKFCSSDKVNLFKKSFNINDNVKLTNQIFSVSFMNRYLCLYRHKNDLEYSFIVGYDGGIAINQGVNYRHVTHLAVSKIFGNELMRDIIKALEKEELTITKLSMNLNASRTTMDRLVGILYGDFAIQVTRTNGNEKYYKLNPEYFLAAKEVSIKEIDDILIGLSVK